QSAFTPERLLAERSALREQTNLCVRGGTCQVRESPASAHYARCAATTQCVPWLLSVDYRCRWKRTLLAAPTAPLWSQAPHSVASERPARARYRRRATSAGR